MSKQLQAAIDLISDPARWTTGEDARDADGRRVDVRNPKAARWSAFGAMVKNYANLTPQLRVGSYCRAMYGTGTSNTNNGHDGHARVLQAMRAVDGGWMPGDAR